VSATVRQLAELIDGKVIGDNDLVVEAARAPHEAQPGDITFLDRPENAPKLQSSKAGAAIVAMHLPSGGKALIRVEDPLLAFATVMNYLHGKQTPPTTGIDGRASVHTSVRIGAEPSIAPFVVIGANSVIGRRCQLHPGVVIGSDCRLGDDVVLHPGVILYDSTTVGDRVIIHARAVLGADGFGYRCREGAHVKVPHHGNVVVGNDVEIGAAATIDRGTFSTTGIGDGTKIDNLVQIAHNCQIGMHNVIASQAGIAGSARTGDRVVIGCQVGVRDHVKIDDEAFSSPRTGIHTDVPAGARLLLYPAEDEQDALEIMDGLKNLPHFRKVLLSVIKILNLEKEIAPPGNQPEAPQ
jgi:UDP-3-O-[3-hydroxymyristoyl] glucosamine N-acyltransferase